MKQITDIFDSYNNKTLTLKDLVIFTLTYISSCFYTYLLYLGHNDRKFEAEVIRQQRSKIFNVKNNISEDLINIADAVYELAEVYDLSKLQMEMINNDHDKSWEYAFFEGHMDDFD